MSKTSRKIARVARKVKRAVTRATKPFRPSYLADKLHKLDAAAISAAEMLADPCNATLAPGCYRGDQGFRTRFVQNVVFCDGRDGVLALPAIYGAVAFYPNEGKVRIWQSGDYFTDVDPTDVQVAAPFLDANASATRCLGACISTTPNSPNLATTGQVYTAIVNSSMLPFTTNISALSNLCNKYSKIPIDVPIETKFVPAAGDENYTTRETTVNDASDVACMLQVFVGIAPNASGDVGSGLTSRVTTIVEWKPKPSIGIVSESFLGNPSANTIEHVKSALLANNPSWWTNVGSLAYSVIRGYATGGVIGAAGAAMKGVRNFV